MSKADSLRSAPASGVNRRGLLRGVGGIAAAGALLALPTATAAAGFSPEFLEYQRRHAAWLAIYAEPYEEDDKWHALETKLSNAMWKAINVILKRTPRSWQDVVELAHVVRMELWEDDLSGWHSEHGDLEPALMKAIFAVAEGGLHA